MSFAIQRDRWQQQLRALIPHQERLNNANYLREQRDAALRSWERASTHLRNVQRAYERACAEAGLRAV